MVDGNNSTYFISAKEDNPWVQLEYLASKPISGIRINLKKTLPAILEKIEVRIGEASVSNKTSLQTVNAFCQYSEKLPVPFSLRDWVDIVCEELLRGKVITIQKKDNNTELNLFKIDLITTCPEDHPYVSSNSSRDFCCSNSANIEIECKEKRKCPSRLCTNYIAGRQVMKSGATGKIIGSVSGVLALLVLGFLLFILMKRKRMTTPRGIETSNKRTEIRPEIVSLNVSHIIIRKPTDAKSKNKGFLTTLKNTAKDSPNVKREFKALEQFVAETIETDKSTSIGKREENGDRNRYKDMVPYDDNIVYLSKPMGRPPSKCINASWITFPSDEQRYLAVQAPKENMFSSFWQLVWEQKVSTIVMITGLVEGGKTKAHQYWPDMDDNVMDLENGMTLNYLRHEFPGTYYSREIEVRYNNHKRNVTQIQTTAWLDMTAPKDIKILLDLVYKAEELVEAKPGPILVHCSAGVGRMGTFIGLYHLMRNYQNNSVREIGFYRTVLQMRENRMKMVQKQPQYLYMVKCLADYVSAQESVYG